MIKFELEAILKHFQSKKLEAQIQKETEQVVHVFTIQEIKFPLFVRLFQESELVQILSFIPCNIAKNAVEDTARLLHALNKEIDIPGFGMDEQASLAFYRVMIPAENKKISTKWFDMYLETIPRICETFAPAIVGVATANLKLEEVMKKLNQK